MSQFISYAQNFEDVMLWRALKHIRQGFYVDVGANDPKFDSVTQAFYERGWRGINIEPMQEYYEALCRERPGDINLPFAVGASESELTFFEVPDTGISSVIPTVVFNNKYLADYAVIERKVPATTLNKIFNEYVQGDIHFLKIDVEGYEKSVMEGLSLTKWRPWILLVEATLPNSTITNDEFPESIILSADYSSVYFDGLNRFFIANEHSELREAFSAPPNVFDYFTLSGQVKANKEIETLRSNIEQTQILHSELEWARAEVETHRSELEWARKDLDYLRTEIVRTRDERDAFRVRNDKIEKELSSHQALTNELNWVRAELESKRAEAEALKKEYINVLYSFSYRITGPLRVLYVQIKKMRNQIRQLLRQSPKGEQLLNTQGNSLAISPEFTGDEQYFLNFFRREINRCRKENKDR